MPIDLKKTNIQYDVDTPEEGYIVLGFDEEGNLVTKNDKGEYNKVVSDILSGNFESLQIEYLTIGNRSPLSNDGIYSISQGLNGVADIDNSFVRGNASIASNLNSFASGRRVSSIGENSFVHEWSNSTTLIGTASDKSTILGGVNNNMTSYSTYSTILGGYNNSITSSETNPITNSTILGGQNQTATLLDTVYLPKMILTQEVSAHVDELGSIYFYDNSFWGKGTDPTPINFNPEFNGVLDTNAISPLTSTLNSVTLLTLGVDSANVSDDGYLSASDWGMFNDKLTAVHATPPFDISNSNISMSPAADDSDGYLEIVYWNKFDNKGIIDTIGASSIVTGIDFNSDYLNGTETLYLSGPIQINESNLGTTILNVSNGGTGRSSFPFTVGTPLLGSGTNPLNDTISVPGYEMIINTADNSLEIRDGQLRINLDGDNGQIDADGDIVAFSQSLTSDVRLKKNISQIENSLDIISNLNGVNYEWKDRKGYQTGFIAQEVEKILPNSVTETKMLNKGDTMYKTIKYNELVPHLVESIKERQLKILELKEKLEELEKGI